MFKIEKAIFSNLIIICILMMLILGCAPISDSKISNYKKIKNNNRNEENICNQYVSQLLNGNIRSSREIINSNIIFKATNSNAELQKCFCLLEENKYNDGKFLWSKIKKNNVEAYCIIDESCKIDNNCNQGSISQMNKVLDEWVSADNLIKSKIPSTSYDLKIQSEDIDCIVIHYTSDNRNEISELYFLEDSKYSISSHYLILGDYVNLKIDYPGIIFYSGNSELFDGDIVQLVSEKNKAHHVASDNNHCIGIEIANLGFLKVDYTIPSLPKLIDHKNIIYDNIEYFKNDFEGYNYWHKYTENQLISLYNLISDIYYRYQGQIPKEHIVGHYDKTYLQSDNWGKVDPGPQINFEIIRDCLYLNDNKEDASNCMSDNILKI